MLYHYSYLAEKLLFWLVARVPMQATELLTPLDGEGNTCDGDLIKCESFDGNQQTEAPKALEAPETVSLHKFRQTDYHQGDRSCSRGWRLRRNLRKIPRPQEVRHAFAGNG